jgi:hypothetical protein
MLCAARFALVAVGFVLFPLLTQGGDTGSITIPKDESEGYKITKTDNEQMAPAGYEGLTDVMTETAVGNTPATAGKTIVAHFTMDNRIKSCPNADGTADGTGVFSMIIDYTDAQANGTSTMHIDVRANAKYHGEVGEDAYLEGLVKAEIDYTYNQSSSFRDKGGAITMPEGSHFAQHITIPFAVLKDLNPPEFKAFSGGDPTKGHYVQAFAVGMALTYWGGVFYSAAETKWLSGQCVQVVFDPPNNTVQPALGTETTVKAEVKTKVGQRVRGHFEDAHAFSAGSVDPTSGLSDVGYPIKFTYTAPNEKAINAGFGVKATSRAGVAVGTWTTSLGTGWSGQISCTCEYTGDEGQSDLQTWSDYSVTLITIDLNNGTGTATVHTETKGNRINKQRALRGGAIVLINDTSQTAEGTFDGTSKAMVDVNINKTNGTYSISPGYSTMAPGKVHYRSCIKDDCTEKDLPLAVETCLKVIGGKLDSPNHLHGSQSDVKTNLGYAHNGKRTCTLTWDLARRGTPE